MQKGHALSLSKGFVGILVLIVVLIALTVGGYFVYKNVSENIKTQKEVENSQSNPQPTAENIRSDNFSLATTWQMGLLTYSNPKLGLSFQYPKSFTVTINDTSSYPVNVKRPSFALTIKTPDVPLEKRQKTGFDFNSYDANTMTVFVNQYDNSSSLTLDSFLADLYSKPGIDGKTPVITTLKKNLIDSKIPTEGSLVYSGDLTENPIKVYFFSNQDKIYSFALQGGNNTGDGYSKDAESIFDQIIKSIKFTNSSDETANPDLIGANWKTYTNTKLKFSFGYPNTYKLEKENGEKVTFSGTFQPGDQLISSELVVNFKPTLDLKTLKNCKDVEFEDNIITKCIDGEIVTKNISGVQMNVFHTMTGSKNAQSSTSYIWQTINDPVVEFIHKIQGGGVESRVDQILSTFKFTQ